MTAITHDPPARRPRGPMIAAFVASAALAVFSLGMFALGGLAFWGDGQKDEHGYVSTDSERFSTATGAIATDNLDLDGLDGVDDVVGRDSFGKIRLEVAPNADKPVFVGIAPTRDVDDYLRGSAHTVVTDIDHSPFHADYSDRAGDRPLTAPARERFWAASAHGAGTQTLTWDAEDGDWSVVVMNADGSRGVDAGVTAGAKLGFLDELGWVGLGTGLLVLAGAGGFLYLAVRRPRQRTPDDPNPSEPRSVAPSAPTI
jgi:hypothetical protein